MTRNIKLGEIGDFMDEQIQKLVKLTTLEWADRVIEENPCFLFRQLFCGRTGEHAHVFQGKRGKQFLSKKQY